MDEEECREWLKLFKHMRVDLNSMKSRVEMMERYIKQRLKNVTKGEIL